MYERATNYRALLRKMTTKDKASCISFIFKIYIFRLYMQHGPYSMNIQSTAYTYRAAKTHRMPSVAGRFSQKSH